MGTFQPRFIAVNDYSEFITELSAFRRLMDRRVPEEFLAQQTIGNPMLPSDLKSLASVCKEKPFTVSATNKSLFHYHNLVLSQLANPAQWLHIPIVDSLSFTARASKAELIRLTKALETKLITDRLNIRPRKKCSKEYAEEKKIRNYYKKTVGIRYRTDRGLSEPIYFSFGLKTKDNNLSLKPLRFSYNPARFEPETLEKIFEALSELKLFDCLLKTLQKAVITRVDLAIDTVGIPVPMLIVGQANVCKYKTYTNHAHIDYGDINAATQYIGGIDKTHILIYDKVLKQLVKEQKHITVLLSPEGNPFVLSRYEWCYKPQGNNGRKIKLKNLHKVTYMFRGKKFFSPLLYREFGKDKQTFLEDGVLNTLAKQSKYIAVPNKPRPIKPDSVQKKQQYRMGQINIMLKKLEKYKLHIDHDWFKAQQTRTLTELYDCMIHFSKN